VRYFMLFASMSTYFVELVMSFVLFVSMSTCFVELVMKGLARLL